MRRVQSAPCDLNCGICYQQYNRADEQPMIVCSNQHSICQYCMGQLQSLICPFCRQVISYATVNYSIQNLLHLHCPNHREEIQNHRFNPLISNNQFVAYNRQVYGIIDQDFDQDNEEIEMTCLYRLRYAIQTQMQGPLIYFLIVQLPFVIFDLIFSKINNDPNCMDKQYNLPVTTRQVFFVMGIIGASITGAFVMLLLLQNSRIMNPCVTACLYHIIMFLVSTKLLFWMITEPIIFLDIVKDHCTGVFYEYCLIQAILFAFVILMATAYSRIRS